MKINLALLAAFISAAAAHDTTFLANDQLLNLRASGSYRPTTTTTTYRRTYIPTSYSSLHVPTYHSPISLHLGTPSYYDPFHPHYYSYYGAGGAHIGTSGVVAIFVIVVLLVVCCAVCSDDKPQRDGVVVEEVVTTTVNHGPPIYANGVPAYGAPPPYGYYPPAGQPPVVSRVSVGPNHMV